MVASSWTNHTGRVLGSPDLRPVTVSSTSRAPSSASVRSAIDLPSSGMPRGRLFPSGASRCGLTRRDPLPEPAPERAEGCAETGGDRDEQDLGIGEVRLRVCTMYLVRD